MKNFLKKVKNWISVRISFLWLIVSIFFISYLPEVSRCSVNTLFDSEKRFYFDFLFFKFQIKKFTVPFLKKETAWIKLFGLIIIFICYLLKIFFEKFLMFFREKTSKILGEVISEKLIVEKNMEWIRSFSEKVTNDFVSLLLSFCKLFINLWAVININLTRNLKDKFLLKSSVCLLIVIFLITNFGIQSKKQPEKEKVSFWSAISEIQKQVAFSESSLLFTAFYFLFFPKESEMINALLFGGNISSILNNLRKFIQIIPQVISTYKFWKKEVPTNLVHKT